MHSTSGTLAQLQHAMAVAPTVTVIAEEPTMSDDDALRILKEYDIVFLVEYVFTFSITPSPHHPG